MEATTSPFLPERSPPRPPRDDSDDTRAQLELCVVVEHVSAIHERSVHRKSGCRICKRSCRVQRRHPLSRGPAPSPCPSCPSSSPLLPLVLHPFLHSPPHPPARLPVTHARHVRTCVSRVTVHIARAIYPLSRLFVPAFVCVTLHGIARASLSLSVGVDAVLARVSTLAGPLADTRPRLGVRQSGDAP